MGNAKIIPPTDALLLPYQKRWVLDNSRLKLMEKSRQIGISWASAYSMVRRKSLAKVCQKLALCLWRAIWVQAKPLLPKALHAHWG